MNQLARPRTLAYFVLRACERLGMCEAEFRAADYADQVRWLVYDAIRRAEESRG